MAGINKAPLYQSSFFELPARLGTNATISHLSRPSPLSLSLLDRVCPSHSRPFFVLNDESFSFFSLHLINKPWKRLLSSHCYGRKSELRLTSELLFVFLFSIVAETRSRLHLEKKFNFRNSYRSFANNASVDFCNFWIVKSFVE